MGTARTFAIKQYLKRHGLKLCWIANSLGMDEANFSYHLKRGLDNPRLVEQFHELMRAHAAAVVEDLQEIQPVTTKLK